MNIALVGYGKMGKAIEAIALKEGHSIVLKINSKNFSEFTADSLKNSDVAIEFSHPSTAVDNITKCLNVGIPVVCGTTGWLAELSKIEQLCNELSGSFLYASNFSVGVNIFFEINKKLAELMDKKNYSVTIEETHHTQKKDSPSGTAITLAEGIMSHLKEKIKWVNKPTSNVEELPIISKRIDSVPGTHRVIYSSPVDDIDIIHTAHNRTGFANGALLAAEFIVNRKGNFTMKDVLGI